jgi:alpha-L-fucosidase
MKINFLLPAILAFLIMTFSCKPGPPKDFLKETREEKTERMQWWHDSKFGMFIHWGIYSVPAGVYNEENIPGIGEWIMSTAKIPVEEYERFGRVFNPDKFNARQWVRIAKDAGMKYIIITSKHHDGFSMWDSKVSKYDIVDFSPYGKDVIKALADECRREGIKLGFYHSIMDWHHPDANAGGWDKYREEYLKPQLEELLTGYGKIAVLWFDGEWIKEWTEEQGKDLYNFVRNLQPDIIINNRVGKGRQGMQGMNRDTTYAGDFGTPEQEILSAKSDFPWESCMTMNDTWGFKTSDTNWKSAEVLIRNLADIVSKGGNFLLNVGPTDEGEIPQASIDRLKEIGEWMRVNGEAVYKVKQTTNYREGEKIRYTLSQNKKYINVFLLGLPPEQLEIKQVKPAEGSEITMYGLGSGLEWSWDEAAGLTIQMPDSASLPCKYVWVLKIEGKEVQLQNPDL